MVLEVDDNKFKNVEFMHCKSLRNVFEKYYNTRNLRAWLRIVFFSNWGVSSSKKVFEIKRWFWKCFLVLRCGGGRGGSNLIFWVNSWFFLIFGWGVPLEDQNHPDIIFVQSLRKILLCSYKEHKNVDYMWTNNWDFHIFTKSHKLIVKIFFQTI